MFDRLFSSARTYFTVCLIVLLVVGVGMAAFAAVAPTIAPQQFDEYHMSRYLFSCAALILGTGLGMLFLWAFVQVLREGERRRSYF